MPAPPPPAATATARSTAPATATATLPAPGPDAPGPDAPGPDAPGPGAPGPGAPQAPGAHGRHRPGAAPTPAPHVPGLPARRPSARRPLRRPGSGRERVGGTATLLDELRGDAARRRRVDPGLAGGLRAWLEDEVAEAASALPVGGPPVVVGRRALAGAAAGVPGGRGEVTVPLVRAAMVAAVFRRFVATGRSDHPVTGALETLAADARDAALAAFANGLGPAEHAALARDVASAATTMASCWPRIPAAWLPRTADRLSVPLAGGRVVLAGTADLVLGAPPTDRCSVCVVEVRAGGPGGGVQVGGPAGGGALDGGGTGEDGCGRRLLALLETLRSGAPPCRVATYDAGSGRLHVEEPTEALLAGAVREVAACAVARCLDRAGGAA